MFESVWTQEDLQEWFEECELEYLFSHKFNTLSGWHYVFHSVEIKGISISVEMFADDYKGLQSNICVMYDSKAKQPMWCFDISEDDGIDKWDRKLKELEAELLM